ncbi:MAG: hypothetical protein JO296_18675 [Pseudonocardiales bacterium]|nr:hypothetical protein [Pseudonocardiales bacterium]
MHAVSLRPHKDLRDQYEVVVQVRCGRCKKGKIIGECYGANSTTLSACWSGASGAVEWLDEASRTRPYSITAFYEAVRHFRAFGTGSCVAHFRCRCGADYPVTAGKLGAAFAAKAAEKTKRDRVIVLTVGMRG